MTGQDAFDRTLADWFEADARQSAPVAGLERVLDVVRRRRPLPALLADLGSHWVGEAPDAGWIVRGRPLPGLERRWSTVLILLLVVAALVAGTILVGAQLIHRSPLATGRLGQLAYVLDGDIYVADWDGGHAVKIADGAPPDGGPGCQDIRGEGRMWSPDGLHLAYRSGCRGTVELTDPEGHPVASFPGDGWLVSWSPDSKRVATWVDLDNTVGIYGLDGVRQALLPVWSGCVAAGDSDPVWSPDGRSVMIRACEVPIDGSPPVRLSVVEPRSHGQWAYSPDGTRVAYIIAGTLVLAAADGSQPRDLIPSGVTSEVWSPTGDRIAFDKAPAASAPNEIRVVDVATGTVTLLASASATESIHLIAFSPAGDRILFSRLGDTDAGSALWSSEADGSGTHLLVTGTAWGDWQSLPDGR